MKYAEYPIEYLYGPYTVRKDTFGDQWFWKKHPDEAPMGSGDRPYDCFMQIDAYENERPAQDQTASNDAKNGLRASIEALRHRAQEETYERVNRAQAAAEAKEMDFHPIREPIDIADMMIKLNSMIVEQKTPTEIFHWISSVLSRIIWAQNIK